MPVDDTSLIMQGLVLMVIGMSVVTTFLIIMIISMNGTARVLQLISNYFPEEVQQQCKLEQAVERNEEIAIVVAAVNAYVKG
ncbi:MAG: hypothetical protein ACD_20C00214G0018 [uncultured bacterium]|nr:MAG: hypothetical protein ACD_20C00214G0018 [uncultured bacterium]HBH19111.1 hypothetical protein [Cyanobacteria bacterium UBA9579]